MSRVLAQKWLWVDHISNMESGEYLQTVSRLAREVPGRSRDYRTFFHGLLGKEGKAALSRR